MSHSYDAEFFERLLANRFSAEAVVALIVGMVAPRSVVDVGCGIGVWLAACLQAGIDGVLGIDGDSVPRDRLLLPLNRFVVADLSAPLALDRRFDLTISLEVAEHLPEASARGFVASLTRLAPVVVFSAAVPLQGGAEHVNEQWQEYWRSKFAELDYVSCAAIRPVIWSDEPCSPTINRTFSCTSPPRSSAATRDVGARRSRRRPRASHTKYTRWGIQRWGEWLAALPRMLMNSARHHQGRLVGKWGGHRSA